MFDYCCQKGYILASQLSPRSCRIYWRIPYFPISIGKSVLLFIGLGNYNIIIAGWTWLASRVINMEILGKRFSGMLWQSLGKRQSQIHGTREPIITKLMALHTNLKNNIGVACWQVLFLMRGTQFLIVALSKMTPLYSVICCDFIIAFKKVNNRKYIFLACYSNALEKAATKSWN